MMGLKIYHYEKCDACRRALKFLQRHGVDYTAVPIREHPPSRAELKRMLDVYRKDVRRLFNTSGRDYRERNLKERLPAMSEEEALRLLSENGNLIKRPFVLSGQTGRVGFKEEEWKVFLNA